MKYLLIPLVLATGQAMACPDAAAKQAVAPASGKAVATARTAPSAKLTAVAPATKAPAKVATKAATEPRKTASL